MKLATKLGTTLAITGAIMGGSLAFAAPAMAAPCGFYPITTGNLGGGDDGHYEKGTYTNCKTDNARITVNYTYASEIFCVTPGETILYANPYLGALTGATWTGSYC